MMIKQSSLSVVLVLSGATFVFAGPFPGNLPGSEIGSGLPAGYEPSGAVWHTRLQMLFTVWDNGMVSMMNPDGSGITSWAVSGDVEAICVADPASDFVYAGLERPDDGIKELNIVTGQVTRFFDLTPWMQSANDNLGLEALTFVPDSTNPEGGLFYAALQEDGKIYVFQLPIESSSSSTAVTYITTIDPAPGRMHLCGLHYEVNSEILYVLWSYGYEKLRAMSKDASTSYVEWDVPGDSQEGIALWEGESPGQGMLFIAEDAGELWRYGFNSMVTVTIQGDGSVMLDPDPSSYYGTFEILSALPDPGYQFIGWSGDLSGSTNPETLLMDYDKDVTATFTPLTGVNEYHDYSIAPAQLGIFPNPCSGNASIDVAVPSEGPVSVSIYDLGGDCVLEICNGTYPAGVQSLTWNGRTSAGSLAPGGVYLVRFASGTRCIVEKLVILR